MDQNKNKLLISIHPDQFNNIYLANMTRQSGDGYYYDSSSMMNEFPFQFKKIAGNIQFIHIGKWTDKHGKPSKTALNQLKKYSPENVKFLGFLSNKSSI